MRTEMEYYDYLFAIQKIAQKSQIIQKNVVAHVYQNFDPCRVINNLNRQIDHLDKLLSIKK